MSQIESECVAKSKSIKCDLGLAEKNDRGWPVAKSFLTKSKFSAAWQCPRKIFYLNNREYGNNSADDTFLKALAEGGFQVGALAQSYYPEGITVATLDKEEAIETTNELLGRDEVTIFEAAFCFDNLFIRADIVRKKGKFIELIEVKAKSYNSDEEFPIWAKREFKAGRYVLLSDYKNYVVDLAFQTHVIQKARPDLTVRSFLMMADKKTLATADGLNQFFKISRSPEGRAQVSTPKLSPTQLGEMILSKKELTQEIRHIFNDVQFDYGPAFHELVTLLSNLTKNNDLGESSHGSQCKDCEFRVKEREGVRSGFNQCWLEKGITPKELADRPFVFEIGNLRTDKFIQEEIYFADQLSDSDLKVKPREDEQAGLSNSERQAIQLDYYRGLRKEEFINAEDLAREMSNLVFPIHFIDFETTMVAIPFHRGRRPYEQMAFQFSHHILHQDGTFEHKTEYLDDRVGKFPNFDFVRALKRALGSDSGAVMRFALHENTVLNQIREQLLSSAEPDAQELINWIQTLTIPPKSLGDVWKPTRQFIDMCEWTKRFFWLPEMKGSNSIKKVLPAVLNLAGNKLKGRFPEWIVFNAETGKVEDPYKLLPPIFADVDPNELAKIEEFLVGDGAMADGGAAMMAWARMQFSEMSDLERKSLKEALLRYCRLDTLAMVMIWEWWTLATKHLSIKKASSR